MPRQNRFKFRNSKSETNGKQNSKHEIRNSKQKGKTQNTNFKTLKYVGEVLIARFWILRIEILKIVSYFKIRISDFSPYCLGFRASDLEFYFGGVLARYILLKPLQDEKGFL